MATLVNVTIFGLLFFGVFLDFAYNMASELRGRGVKTRGGRGDGRGVTSDWANFRADRNFFAVLGEPEQDYAQDGDALEIGVGFGINKDKDGCTVVRGKQSKRQHISSGGESGPHPVSACVNSEPSDYDTHMMTSFR